MTKHELARSLHSNLFGSRDDIKEAYAFALQITGGDAGALTGIHVLLNTISKEIEKLEEGEPIRYTEDREAWYEFEHAVAEEMTSNSIGREEGPSYAVACAYYEANLGFVRSLEQADLIEFVRKLNPDLLEMVEV